MPKYAFLVLIYLAMSGNLTSAEDSKLITIDSLKKSKSSVTGEIEEALWFNISKEEHKLLSRYRYTFSISSRLSPRHLVRHSSFGAIRGVDRFDDPRQANSRYVTYHLHKDAQWITVYERPRNAPEGGDHHETDIILQRINFAKFRKNIVYCPSLNARTLEVLDPTGMSSSSYLLDTLENCLYTPTNEDCFVKCKGAQHKFKNPEEDSVRLTCVPNSQDTFQFALVSACGGTQVCVKPTGHEILASLTNIKFDLPNCNDKKCPVKCDDSFVFEAVPGKKEAAICTIGASNFWNVANLKKCVPAPPVCDAPTDLSTLGLSQNKYDPTGLSSCTNIGNGATCNTLECAAGFKRAVAGR
eukprot:447561_1